MSQLKDSNYMKIKSKFSFHLKASGSFLFRENTDVLKAEEEIKECLKFLNEMRRTCHPFVTDVYKEDFNQAFTMYFKVLESKDVDSLEDEAELVSLTLDLSDHEDMLEDRCEVLKGLISKILTRYRGPTANSQRDRIVNLVSLMSSRHTQSLILIELHNQTQVFDSLPTLPLMQEVSFSEATELVGLIRQSRGTSHLLSWLLDTPWTFSSPLQTEEVLTKCLWICGESEELLEIAMKVLTRYIRLLVSDQNAACQWKCCKVFLGLGRKFLHLVHGDVNTEDTEKWLEGLAIVSLVMGNHSAHLDYIEHLLKTLIQQGKLSKLKRHLSALKDGHSPVILSALFLSQLFTGDCEGASTTLDQIAKAKSFKSGSEKRACLSSLVDLVTAERCQLDRRVSLQLMDCLVTACFHCSVTVLEFSLLLAPRLDCVAQLAWRLLTDSGGLAWARGADSRTWGLCWQLGLTSPSPLTRLSLHRLVGLMLPPSDPRKVSEIFLIANSNSSYYGGSSLSH